MTLLLVFPPINSISNISQPRELFHNIFHKNYTFMTT